MALSFAIYEDFVQGDDSEYGPIWAVDVDLFVNRNTMAHASIRFLSILRGIP